MIVTSTSLVHTYRTYTVHTTVPNRTYLDWLDSAAWYDFPSVLYALAPSVGWPVPPQQQVGGRCSQGGGSTVILSSFRTYEVPMIRSTNDVVDGGSQWEWRWKVSLPAHSPAQSVTSRMCRAYEAYEARTSVSELRTCYSNCSIGIYGGILL